MASNIRRSKRTFSQRFLAAENQVNAMARRPSPSGIGARTIMSDMLAPGAIDARNFTVGLNNSLAFVQASANGKNTIYRQPNEPSGGTYRTGDIWFDTDNDNRFSRYKEDPEYPGWFPFSLGDNALDSISANKITAGTIDAEQITVSNLDAGNMTVGTLVGRNIIGNYLAGGSIDIGGTGFTVTNASLTTNVVTLTTAEAHGYAIGDKIIVGNVGDVIVTGGENTYPFNGEYTITLVPSSTTFRYAREHANIASTAVSGNVFSRGGANSFHVDSFGKIWSGSTSYDSATFKVSAAGVMTATSGFIGGWSIGQVTGAPSGGGAAFNGAIYKLNGGVLSAIAPDGWAWFSTRVITPLISGYAAPTTTSGASTHTLTGPVDGKTGFLRNISYGTSKPDIKTPGDIHFS